MEVWPGKITTGRILSDIADGVGGSAVVNLGEGAGAVGDTELPVERVLPELVERGLGGWVMRLVLEAIEEDDLSARRVEGHRVQVARGGRYGWGGL